MPARRSPPGLRGGSATPLPTVLAAGLEVMRAAGDPQGLPAVAHRIAEGARALLGARLAAVYQLVHGSGDLWTLAVAGDGGPALAPGSVLERGTGLPGLALGQRRTVWSPDVLADPRVSLTAEGRAAVEQSPWRAAIALPLAGQERPLGAFVVADAPGHWFTDGEREILEAFAAQAAAALEVAAARESAERRRQELELLAEVARHVAEVPHVEPMLQRLAVAARGLTRADLALVALRDEGTGCFVVRAQSGGRRHWLGRCFAPGATPGSREADQGQTVAGCGHEAVGPTLPEEVEAARVVTIRASDSHLGMLLIGRRGPGTFVREDQELVERLAVHAAVSLRNAQLLTAALHAGALAEEAERRFEALLDEVGAIVWEAAPVSGTGGRRHYRHVSQNAAALLGYPLARWKEAPGLWPEIVHPDDRAHVAAALETLGPDSGYAEIEYRVTTRGGQTRWVRERVRQAPGGCWRGVLMDVTRERLARTRHDHVRERLDQLLRMIHDAVIMVDAEQRIVAFSLGAEETFGYRAGEVLGRPLSVLLPPGSAAVHRAHIEAFAAAPEATRRMDARRLVRGRRKDGREFPAEASIARSTIEGQVFYAAILRDVTERLRVEETLRSSEARYRGLFEASRDAILVLQADGCVEDANPACGDLFRCAPGHLLGRDFAALVGDAEGGAGLLEAMEREGLVRDRALRLRRPDGSQFEVQCTVVRRPDGPGQVPGHVAFLRDVTEQRRLEAELHQAQRLEALGRLAGGVAHDFNNLLAVILGRADLLLEGLPEGDPRRGDAGAVARAARRAADLTGQLLAYGRRQTLEPGSVRLPAMLHDLIPMLDRTIREDIALVADLAPDLPPVRADRVQLEQVLVNLVLNARDAMPQGGRITIAAAPDVLDRAAAEHAGVGPGPYVRLAVADTGQGMPPEVLEHVFEPFFTTKPPGQGTGLGLATVWGIVRQHGGHVVVRSEPGRGSTFTVWLPVASGETPAPAAPEAPAPAAPGGETILLVEDQDEVRAIVHEVLQGAGYRVLEASEPTAALSLAEAHPGPIHLLVTDAIMPGLTGRELAHRLRVVRPEVRVLFISGYPGDVLDPRTAVEPGAPLLGKPFSPADLLAAVGRARAG